MKLNEQMLYFVTFFSISRGLKQATCAKPLVSQERRRNFARSHTAALTDDDVPLINDAGIIGQSAFNWCYYKRI